MTETKLNTTERLAYDRTRLAHERTMMAWVRTATSMITFGFGVYKFFQLERPEGEQSHHLIGPRGFALLMITVGLVSLLLATFEHRKNMQALRVEAPDVPRSLAAVVAAFISLLGIAALLVVAFRQ